MPKPCNEQIIDLRTSLSAIQRSAQKGLVDIDGDTTTYEEAFRKLELACGTLMFIEQHAERVLNEQ